MNRIAIPNGYERLYICGDIHGNFAQFYQMLKEAALRNAVVVVAGDCGLGFGKSGVEEYRREIADAAKIVADDNILLLMVRGNHDDPSYFSERKIGEEFVKCLPDYSVISFQGRNILCVGGGISIDRTMRQRRMWMYKRRRNEDVALYWEDEDVVYDEQVLDEIKALGVNIDTVVSHSAPSFCFPTSKDAIQGWLARDSELESDLIGERLKLDAVLAQLKRDGHGLSNWYYGHFHDTSFLTTDDVDYHLLNIAELREYNNYDK